MNVYNYLSTLFARGHDLRYKSINLRKARTSNDRISILKAESIPQSNQHHVESHKVSIGRKSEGSEMPNGAQTCDCTIGWKTPSFMIATYTLGARGRSLLNPKRRVAKFKTQPCQLQSRIFYSSTYRWQA